MWEFYDFPPAHPQRQSQGKPGKAFTWPEICSHWRLIVADFQRFYHVDLSKVYRVETWRWFTDLVSGLLCTPESLLRQALTEKEG